MDVTVFPFFKSGLTYMSNNILVLCTEDSDESNGIFVGKVTGFKQGSKLPNTMFDSIITFVKSDFNDGFVSVPLCKEPRNNNEILYEGIEFDVSKPPAYDHINPDHYKKFSVETIDMLTRIYGVENVAIYCEMNAFKYSMRAGDKPNQPVEQDLKKKKWYLDKANELRQRKTLPNENNL